MHKPHWFFKFAIFLATVSLLLMAIAPLIYLVAAPGVSQTSVTTETAQ